MRHLPPSVRAATTGRITHDSRRRNGPGRWICRCECVRQWLLGHDVYMPPEPAAYVPNELLGRLVGFRLHSVQFVMDYVQLRFDGPTEDMPVLNCDVLP